jgi:hypothetical protein
MSASDTPLPPVPPRYMPVGALDAENERETLLLISVEDLGELFHRWLDGYIAEPGLH